MSKWGWARTIVTLTLVTLLVGACTSSGRGRSTATTAGGTTKRNVGVTARGGASAPGISDKTVRVGLLTDLTGAAASTFADTPDGAQARFSLQNAQGGVFGRALKLDIADTGSTPVGAQNAAQALVAQKSVFGVIAVSALTFGGSAYLHQEGIPVTGSALDGPEWYTEPNLNMFNLEGTSSPRYPSYTSEGQFYKSLGVRNIGFVADDTPSSARGVKQVMNSLRNVGLRACTSIVIHLGAVDFNVITLQLKQAGCDAAECSCLLSSSLALATALHDSQVHIPLVFDAGPAQQILDSPGAIMAATGGYFPTLSAYSGPGYDAFISSLKHYDPHYTVGLPDLGVLDGWIAADLFIQGMQAAGPNPTRQAFISQLRHDTTWSGNGLRPGPASFDPFGQAPPQFCLYYLKLQNSQYHNYPPDGRPFCGALIPNSNAS